MSKHGVFRKLDCYRVKTFCPGFKVYNIEGNAECKEIFDAQRNGKLKQMYPDKSQVNRHARNFHTDDMFFANPQMTEIKEEVILIEVPKLLPDGSKNEEGIIDLDTEAEVIMLLNALKGRADKRICLDTNVGKDLERKDEILKAPVAAETDDISKRKMPTRK